MGYPLSMDVYGIKTCDSCRKALRWLDEAGVNYRWHNLHDEGLDLATAEHWLAHVDPYRLVNRRSTTWQGLNEAQREQADSVEGAAGLLAQYPTLAKRPIIDTGEVVLVGFTDGVRSSLLKLP